MKASTAPKAIVKASTAPKAIAVEVVAAQATEADSAMVAQLESSQGRSLPGVAYVVRIRLKALPEATSQGWALYVDKLRIPKYWTYRQGIYFKVFDPQFFIDHKGGKLRFSQNGTSFTDIGLKLVAPRVPTKLVAPKAPKKKSSRAAARLPLQDDLLN